MISITDGDDGDEFAREPQPKTVVEHLRDLGVPEPERFARKDEPS